MPSPKQTHITRPELVQVDTALTVLSQVNLLRESNSIALDIGGSLAKLVYLQHHKPAEPHPPPLKIHLVDGTVASALSVHVPALQGTLHFFAFETRNTSQLLRFIRQHWAHNTARRKIRATGGGSYKYADIFLSEIDVTLVRLDEMKATVAGLNFLLTSIKNEVYTYSPPSTRSPIPAQDIKRDFVTDTIDNPFPYLLVNIGSGVSIVKVTGHNKLERVSGSSLGGGTFWGLARMLLDCATFDDVIELTRQGDNSNVDMLVKDIYGGHYQNLGLDANIIAASFGRATMREEYTRHPASVLAVMRERFVRACVGSYHLWLSFLLSMPGFGSILRRLSIGVNSEHPPALITHTGAKYRPQDVALSLLRMVSYNIGQIAYLNARVHNLDHIYFGGNFIRNHPFTIADISFAVGFWSGGDRKALFLRHDGYLGAIGAFIGGSSATPTKAIEENDDVLPDFGGEDKLKKRRNSSQKD